VKGEDVVREWFLVMEKANPVLRLLLTRYIKIMPDESWADISYKLSTTFLSKYYGGYLKAQFPGWPWDNQCAQVILSKVISLWENIKLMGIRYWINRLSDSFISPEGRSFAIIPLLAFSLKSDGKVEGDCLPLVRDILNPLYPHTSPENAWEKEKKIFCSVIRKYKHSKNSTRNIGNIFDKVKFWG